MESINKILDNREIATLVWLGVLIIWAILHRKTRESLIGVLKAFTQKTIFISSILMSLYIGAIIYILYEIGLWDVSILSDTVIWVVGVAFILFINIGHTQEDSYFLNAVVENIKLAVFIEFIANLYVFNFWIELALVPVLVFIGAMLGVASASPKYKQVASVLSIIVGSIGICFLAYAVHNIIFDFQGFASIQNLRTFFTPLVLTVMFLPFIYLLAIYVTYDLIFMRIRYLIKDNKLATYTKWKTVFAFHINLQSLNRWLKKVVISTFQNREDMKQAIMSIKMSGA